MNETRLKPYANEDSTFHYESFVDNIESRKDLFEDLHFPTKMMRKASLRCYFSVIGLLLLSTLTNVKGSETNDDIFEYVMMKYHVPMAKCRLNCENEGRRRTQDQICWNQCDGKSEPLQGGRQRQTEIAFEPIHLSLSVKDCGLFWHIPPPSTTRPLFQRNEENNAEKG